MSQAHYEEIQRQQAASGTGFATGATALAVGLAAPVALPAVVGMAALAALTGGFFGYITADVRKK